MPQLLLALSLAIGVATVVVVILNERNSALLAPVRAWPRPARAVLALVLCGAVAFTTILVLMLAGVSREWASLLSIGVVVVYAFRQELGNWWRSRRRADAD